MHIHTTHCTEHFLPESIERSQIIRINERCPLTEHCLFQPQDATTSE